MKSLLALIVSVLVLVGCGGNTPEPTPETFTIQITPGAALLTKSGETKALTAKVLNSSGNAVDKTVTWTSSNPNDVQISSDGVITALKDLGASQIVAEFAGIKSAPVLVSVAQPATGVTLISDAQVRGEATLVDPNAEADSDNPYEVLLTGITPPAAGSLLLGSEGKAVGGKVISSVQEGDAVRVRLKLVPITQLMQTAQIKETLDYTNLEPNFPLEITQGYDIKRVDGEYIFTPKSGVAFAKPREKITNKIGPFECDSLTPELPISLSQPAQFSLKFNPSLEIDFDRETGLKKLIARAEMTAKIKASLILSLGGVVGIDCVAIMLTKMLPLPGWAGLIAAGEVEAGLGFEIEGKVSIPLVGVELSSETKGKLEMGLDCTAGECKTVRNFNPVNTNQVRFIPPTSVIENIRLELSAFGYGIAKLKMGATLLEKLRMDVVTARAGLKLEGNFAPPSTQLEPSTNLLEPDYQSSYKLDFLVEIIAGGINKAGDSKFKKLLMKLGIFKYSPLKYQTAYNVATSPKGSATQDKNSFAAGDTVNFNVKLDPATINFPTVGYNVERILIMRKVSGSPAETITSIGATAGQTEFKLPWVADVDSTDPKGSNFYAFVDTQEFVPFDLEIAKVGLSADPKLFVGTFAIDETYTRFIPESRDPEVRYQQIFQLHGDVEQKRKENGKLFFQVTNVSAFKFERESNRYKEGQVRFAEVSCTFYEVYREHDKSSDSLLSPEKIFFKLKLDYPSKTQFQFLGADVQAFRSGVDNTQVTVSNKSGTNCPSNAISRNSSTPYSGEVYANDEAIDYQKLIGDITRDAEGNGSIDLQFAETLDLCTKFPFCSEGETETTQYSVRLNLKQGKTSKDADLELGILAPASATLGGTLTYAVNLRNKSTNDATGIRAEFYLPEGFTILATPGWTGCTTLQTTVICTAPTLAANDRRALLIDVQAPTAVGAYIVSARVSSDQNDPDQSDNFDTGATLLLEPPEPVNP
jgi:uncharacterized repeat protein (TIGR01451 family)